MTKRNLINMVAIEMCSAKLKTQKIMKRMIMVLTSSLLNQINLLLNQAKSYLLI